MPSSTPVSRIANLIMGKGPSGEDVSMQENSVPNSPVASSSRSSTIIVTSKSSTMDPFGTTSKSNIGYEKVSEPEFAELDVWFVHGLTGCRKKTWTHAKSGTFWPELLAKDFPNARVITYGYDADIAKFAKNWGNASSEGLKSYGTDLAYAVRDSLQNESPRPIYFMPHSLGGLVVEQALLECLGSDRTLHPIVHATTGIMFMGTPHQGSPLVTWASRLRKFILPQIRSTNKKILDVLKTDSELCQNLEESFQQQAKHGEFKKIKLFSFYETQLMPGLDKLVVPEKSAVLKADFKRPIEGTHTSMTRFYGPDDPEYLKVKSQMTSWLSPEENPQGRLAKKKKKRKDSGVNMVGATFTGMIRGTVNANANASRRNMYILQGNNNQQKFVDADKSSTEESSEEEDTDSDSEDEDESGYEQSHN